MKLDCPVVALNSIPTDHTVKMTTYISVQWITYRFSNQETKTMSKPRSYRLVDPNSAEAYRDLLTGLFTVATSCSVVVQDNFQLTGSGMRFLRQAQNWLVEKTRVSEWPGTRLTNGKKADLFRFRTCPELLVEFLTHTHSFSDWTAPHLPEDPAFYRADGSLLLGSVIHEGDVFLKLTDEELTALRKAAPTATLENE